MAVVSGLVCYPIKECAAVDLVRGEVTLAGLKHDRTFAIVDRSGATMWQGVVPRMATVRCRVLDAGIVLSAPGADDLEVDVTTDGRTLAVDVEKWPGRGIDQGDAAAEWLSRFLDVPVRLVRRDQQCARTAADSTDVTRHVTAPDVPDTVRSSRLGGGPAEEVRQDPNL